MNKVDFFIIGAQKAGTTSLYNYLAEHPDIFMPVVKENQFFVEKRFYDKGESYYHKFYSDYKSQKLAGGAYVHMFSSKEAPERVYNYNKNAKILIMLRNPIDRAYSAYHFALKNGWESSNINFLSTLKLQDERINGSYTEQTNLSYFYCGLYYQHISQWLQWFPKENLYIGFNSDFKKNAAESIKKVFQYLNVPDDIQVNTNTIHNKSGDVRFKSLHYFLRNKENKFKKNMSKLLPFQLRYVMRTRVRKQFDKFNMIEKEYKPLSQEERKIVFNYFENDIKQLSQLLGKDLYQEWQPV